MVKDTFEILLKKLKAGDPTSLETIYFSSFPSIRNYIRKNSGSEDDAKDIFHDGLTIFIQKVKSDEVEPYTKVEAYLFAICKNLWLKKLRDEPRHIDINPIENEISDDFETFDQEHHKNVERALKHYLGKVGEKCNNILQAYYYHKLSMKEIAEKFAYKTEAAAKNRKYACLQNLITIARDALSVYRGN